MKADLIACTLVSPEVMRRHGFEPEGVGSDDLAEFAGRACYQSFHRPNPATAENRGYLAHIIEVGHFSVLEHGSATFYITGVSRALTHELVRHRHFSYSQVSQRYVDESEGETVIPPAYVEDPVVFGNLAALVREVHSEAKDAYETLAECGAAAGLPRKEARQAARSVLPNATETKIVVTGNMRAWREFLAKRWHVAADAEIQELAGLILPQLCKVAPGSFQDVPSVPYTYPEPSIAAAEAEVAMREAGMTEGAIGVALVAMFGDAA